MPVISVPVPTWQFDAVDAATPDLAALERPIEAKCAPVSLPDGTPFDAGKLGTAGFFIYRQMTAVVAAQVWNEDAKEWQPDPGAMPAALKPKPFAFKPGESLPWQTVLVAAGQKDRNGDAQFGKATGGFPRYFLRTYFATTWNGVEFIGLSAPSATFRFISALDTLRAGIEVEPEDPSNATVVRLFLRNAARQRIGAVEVRQVGGDAQIDIAQFTSGGTPRAVIRLLASGEIRLEPLPGQQVVIAGDVETERVFYRPNGGGPKQYL